MENKACGWFDMFRLGPGCLSEVQLFGFNAFEIPLNVVRSNSLPLQTSGMFRLGPRSPLDIVQTYTIYGQFDMFHLRGLGVLFIEVQFFRQPRTSFKHDSFTHSRVKKFVSYFYFFFLTCYQQLQSVASHPSILFLCSMIIKFKNKFFMH